MCESRTPTHMKPKRQKHTQSAHTEGRSEQTREVDRRSQKLEEKMPMAYRPLKPLEKVTLLTHGQEWVTPKCDVAVVAGCLQACRTETINLFIGCGWAPL